MRSLLLFNALLFAPGAIFAASVTFTASGNVVALSGSTAFVNATVTVSTFQDLVVVQVMNNIVGASRDLQGISAVDFRLNTGQVQGSISSQAGLVRTIAGDGTWVAGDTAGGRPADFSNAAYASEWAVYNAANQQNGLSGGLTVTTLTGGNPSLTILGAPNASNLYNSYGNPNKAVTSHNPYLATAGQPITFNILVPGVTVGTTILTSSTNVRFFFGTDRSAYLDGVVDSPEAGSFALMGFGLIALSIVSRWKSTPRA